MIDAADAGVPQHRVRLFIVGSLRRAIRIPEPNQRHVPVGDIIDWDSGRWSLIDKLGRAEATLARVANGRRQFGKRFVMPFYKSGSGLTGRSLDRPVGTITTKARWAVVDGRYMRMFSTDECRKAMSFPADYWLPKTHKDAVYLLGNAVPPRLAKYVIKSVVAI